MGLLVIVVIRNCYIEKDYQRGYWGGAIIIRKSAFLSWSNKY